MCSRSITVISTQCADPGVDTFGFCRLRNRSCAPGETAHDARPQHRPLSVAEVEPSLSTMVQDQAVDEVRAATLSMLSDDFVGVWQIPWVIVRLYPTFDEDKIRVITLRVVEDLLAARMMRAGQLVESGRRFSDSGLSPKEVAALIETEWHRQGRAPNVGEVIWFAPVD